MGGYGGRILNNSQEGFGDFAGRVEGLVVGIQFILSWMFDDLEVRWFENEQEPEGKA